MSLNASGPHDSVSSEAEEARDGDCSGVAVQEYDEAFSIWN